MGHANQLGTAGPGHDYASGRGHAGGVCLAAARVRPLPLTHLTKHMSRLRLVPFLHVHFAWSAKS